MYVKLETLIREYISCAISQGTYTESGRHKEANKSYDEVLSTFRKIRESSDSWQDAMIQLTHHAEPYVRLWSATHTLIIDAPNGENVLQELMVLPGMIGLSAEMTLIEWKKGSLEII